MLRPTRTSLALEKTRLTKRRQTLTLAGSFILLSGFVHVTRIEVADAVRETPSSFDGGVDGSIDVRFAS